MAGLGSTVSLYPLELVKTRMQVTNRSVLAYSSFFHAIQTVYKSEGISGFYKGLFPAALASSTSWGGYFFVYEASKQRKLSNKIDNSPLDSIDHVNRAKD